MSSSDRQNKLLIAEDWKRIYQTFTTADFKSYDFENLRRIMIDYIRLNYPEDFNDYIESSEFLALIDLLAFLGQSIAFRVDLNARENFLELAERRDSVLKLARTIGYNPKRNQAARGLLKFATVSTTETVIDNNGRNLANQVIAWNDSSNPNWYDQFIKVINSAISINRQFGTPIDKAVIYDIPTEQYRFEGVNTDVPIYNFSKTINGQGMNFEITSTTFKNANVIYEETPQMGNKLAFIYRNDGKGAGSPGSGFFLNMVQGSLNNGTFTITQPTSNEIVDIASNNINNSDVWLYSINSSGAETDFWYQVPNTKNSNIIYNTIDKNIRNIYNVISRVNDSISLIFGDGLFGNLPYGSFRIYYRISNGLSYIIKPIDIRSVAITVPYISHENQPETLNITLKLATSISNAQPTETNESIKYNAPAMFYTQNRMITGEDYNISPLGVDQNIIKVKAVNRTASGISRYFDLIDITGKYSSTKLYGSDGILYKQDYTKNDDLLYDNDLAIKNSLEKLLSNLLTDRDLAHFYYFKSIFEIPLPRRTIWSSIKNTKDTGLGNLYVDGNINEITACFSKTLNKFKSRLMIRFTAPIINNIQHYFDTKNLNALTSQHRNRKGIVDYIWVEALTAYGNCSISLNAPNMVLNKPVPTHAIATHIVPDITGNIDPQTIDFMVNQIANKNTFGLTYNVIEDSWITISQENLNTLDNFSYDFQGDTSSTFKDSSWFLSFIPYQNQYIVKSRRMRYVFESEHEIKFYFNKYNKIYDRINNQIVNDEITVLDINHGPGNSITPLGYDLKWNIVSDYINSDGYSDPKKVLISFTDNDANSTIDNIESFIAIVGEPNIIGYDTLLYDSDYYDRILDIDLDTYYIAQEQYQTSYNFNNYQYVDAIRSQTIKIIASELDLTVDELVDQQHYYFIDTNLIKKYVKSLRRLEPTIKYKIYPGRDRLKFQYSHSADLEARIDPSMSNIIDLFVLTRTYDKDFRLWIKGAIDQKPVPPTTFELYEILSPYLDLIKPTSDEIIYHSIEYRLLFGSLAEPMLQATFKIIKNPELVVSDNEVKVRTISAINKFFNLENWDFGETFYFSELSAYVVKELSPNIVSFTIVPKQTYLNYSEFYEIHCDSHQMFLSCATTHDIEIISAISDYANEPLQQLIANN